MKTVLMMLVATMSSASGDALMSKGMKQLGDVSHLGHHFLRVFAMFGNRFVILSICCSALYFFLYSFTLSWADLTVAQPMNAMGFVFVALLGHYVLQERLSPQRIVGIGLIILGVVLVSLDQRARSIR